MTSRLISVTVLYFLLRFPAFGQQPADSNYVFWSSTHRLTVDDFGIKTKNGETSPSFAQFSVDYQLEGFSFLRKNFNKNVRNYIIRSASSIDTTSDVEASLRYQQTLFDLCEIYTRQFRKGLSENKNKLSSGSGIAEKLNQKCMTDFANRRILYDKETMYGTDTQSQAVWEAMIKSELEFLKDYVSEP